MLYRLLFDTVISRTDPEEAHRQAVDAIQLVGESPLYRILKGTLGYRGRGGTRTVLPRAIPGLVGLAAGMDKNATAICGMDALGFGFVEIGTVTPVAQIGNEKPRMWRHPEDRALRNAMGFNNDGADAVAQRLARLRSTKRGRSIVVGVNIGKNKTTPESDAVRDYQTCARKLARYADYLVINVSSPNTPGLRDLQTAEALTPIVRATKDAAVHAAGREVPIFVKIAPDMAIDDLPAVVDVVVNEDIAGVVATNTTIAHSYDRGGVSGRPLTEHSRTYVRRLRDLLPIDKVIIGVGGISTVDDAHAMIAAGADLIQVYSSFVYEGPCLPGSLNRALSSSN